MEIHFENTEKYLFIDADGFNISLNKKGLITMIFDDFRHEDGRIFETLIFQHQLSPRKRGRPCKRNITKCSINEGKGYLILDVSNVNAREVSNLMEGERKVLAKNENQKTSEAIRQGYVDFIEDLNKFNWTHFITFTAHKYLSPGRARWIMDRMYSNLNRGHDIQMYWIVEKFKAAEGYHVHVLLAMPGTGVEERVDEEWQRLSCAKRDKEYARTEIQNYDRKLGAGHYLTKEILNKKGDYDFLIPT